MVKNDSRHLFSNALKRAGMSSGGGVHKDVKPIQMPPTPAVRAFEDRVRSTEESKMMHLRNMRSLPPQSLPKPIEKKPYIPPRWEEIDTPSWFRKDEETFVSIIIPLFRSTEVVRKLIDSWDFGGPSAEVIFVSDACPTQSHSVVVPTFAERSIAQQIGRIYAHSHQCGFAAGCNTGANNSKGQILVFLNADTEVTPGWLENLIKPLEDRSIGIVGNLQLKMDGSIDSAGSEWSNRTRSFEHIGRNIHKGIRLSKSMRPETAPEDVLADGEREMVTGCCVAIRKDFYISIGGFDEKYRVGYWEDADICMKVHEAGKKVYFTSKSIIRHKGSHSGSSGHPYMRDNAKLFYSRWIDNGKFNQIKS